MTDPEQLDFQVRGAEEQGREGRSAKRGERACPHFLSYRPHLLPLSGELQAKSAARQLRGSLSSTRAGHQQRAVPRNRTCSPPLSEPTSHPPFCCCQMNLMELQLDNVRMQRGHLNELNKQGNLKGPR